MNRRKFLAGLSVAPLAVPLVAAAAVSKSTDFAILADNYVVARGQTAFEPRYFHSEVYSGPSRIMTTQVEYSGDHISVRSEDWHREA